MILANFFDKSLAAVAEALNGASADALKAKLSKLKVAIAFDKTATCASEGRVALGLTVDLLSRLYPGLCIHPLDEHATTTAFAEKLKKTATSIHPKIDLKAKLSNVVACLVVGDSAPTSAAALVFIGSEGWTARLSTSCPLGSRDSGNPFGAAAAACLAVASVFRIVFANELSLTPQDETIEFDVLHQKSMRSEAPINLPSIVLPGTYIVGLGAIGRAAAWTLARVEGLSGELQGIDHEVIERTNLQRYVGTTQSDQRKSRLKTATVKKMFDGTGVTFVEHPVKWGQYLAANRCFDLGTVAVALDTPEGRIDVQASLPKKLLNAWTQPGDLGVSRHNFLEGPCLACLYLPERKAKSFSENVADALGLPELEIREKLFVEFRVDREFLHRVSDANQIDLQRLLDFENEPLQSFYAKAVCGTVHFRGARGNRGAVAVAVPMAFQSALAGIMLAAEIIADAADLRTLLMQPVTKLNLLRPFGTHLQEPAAKHGSGHCLCQDEIYIAAYRQKFPDHDNNHTMQG